MPQATDNELLGEPAVLSLLEGALRGSPADATELVMLSDTTGVTRYANSEIHQNTRQHNVRIAVRVSVGKAKARIFTNSLDVAEIKATIKEAVALCRLQAPNPRFSPLPTPDTGYAPPARSPQSYFTRTAEMTPQDKADAVGTVINTAQEAGYSAFGTCSSSVSELTVVSTAGIRAHAAFTTAYLKALVEGPSGTGFADAYNRDAAQISPGAVAAEAVAKCRANHSQAEIEPGDFEAVFDQNAVADMLRFPVVWGIGARSVLDGQSFMAGRLGETVTGEQVNIWDDPTDPRCLPIAIDFEGLPASRVDIIRNGVAVGPVYDSETAFESGTKSTGHAGNPFQMGNVTAAADNIVMPVGTARVEDLVKNVKHGVWVTRFHYTHCPDPKRVIATGTTRDGTFLIQDGEVVGALKNLRLEMSVLDLLASMQEVGVGKLCQDWWAANGMDTTNYFVPSIRFGRCTFTGVTTF